MCPSCGYCPSCGRGFAPRLTPVYPYVPLTPQTWPNTGGMYPQAIGSGLQPLTAAGALPLTWDNTTHRNA